MTGGIKTSDSETSFDDDGNPAEIPAIHARTMALAGIYKLKSTKL